jgi:hypothetical protein
MKTLHLPLHLLASHLVVLVAAALRLRAVNMLPIDFDEDDYLPAGQQFATAIQTGDWAGITRYNYRQEHPPLQKIAYGIALAALPPAPEIPDLPTKVTLAMAIAGMTDPTGASWNMPAAISVMMSVPIVVIFLAFERYLADRFLLGSMEA